MSLCLSFFYCWWWSRLGQLLMTFFFVKSRHHFQSHGRLSFRLWKKKIYSAFWLLWDFSAIFIDFCSIWSWYLIWNLYHKNTKATYFYRTWSRHIFWLWNLPPIFSHFQRLIFFFLFSITIDFDTNDFIKQSGLKIAQEWPEEKQRKNSIYKIRNSLKMA